MSDAIAIRHCYAAQMNAQALQQLMRFRAEMFYHRLGWDVTVRDGMEMDQYDDLNPVYVVARGVNDDIQSCARLLPTTGPYMLPDIFPQLLRGEPAPAAATVWEFSRLAVIPEGLRPLLPASSPCLPLADADALCHSALVHPLQPSPLALRFLAAAETQWGMPLEA